MAFNGGLTSGLGFAGARVGGPQFGIIAIGVDAGATALLRSLSVQSKLVTRDITLTSQSLDIFRGALSGTTKLLGLGLVTLGAAALTVNEFRDNLVKTAAVLNQDVSVVFEDVGRKSIKLSQEFGFSAATIQGAALRFGQAGFSLREIGEALPSALQFARATVSDLSDATDLATKIMRGFKLEITDIDHIFDSLMFILNRSPATVMDLKNAFKQLIPIAGQLGISLESVGASLVAVTKAGLSGETAGTSMATGLLHLLEVERSVNPETNRLVKVFRETIQSTGDLTEGMDAFVQASTGGRSNIESFSQSLAEIRKEINITNFENLTDAELFNLADRFKVLGIVVDVFNIKSSKFWLNFLSQARDARLETVAMELGLIDTASAAEKAVQSISVQFSNLRNSLITPLLEGSFADNLVDAVEGLNQSGALDRLAGIFDDMANSALTSVVRLIDTLIPLLTELASAGKNIAGAFAFVAQIVSPLLKIVNMVPGLIEMVATFKLLKIVFGDLARATTELGAKMAATFGIDATTPERSKLIAQIQAEDGALRQTINTKRTVIAVNQERIGVLRQEIAAINDLDVSIQKEQLLAPRTIELKRLEAINRKATTGIRKLEGQSIDLLLAKQELEHKAIQRANFARARAAFAQQGLNIAVMAGVSAVFAFTQGNEILSAVLATLAIIGLVSYTVQLYRASAAAAALAGTTTAAAFATGLLKSILNPANIIVIIGVIGALTFAFSTFGDSVKKTTGDVSKFESALTNFNPNTEGIVSAITSLNESARKGVSLIGFQTEQVRDAEGNLKTVETEVEVGLVFRRLDDSNEEEAALIRGISDDVERLNNDLDLGLDLELLLGDDPEKQVRELNKILTTELLDKNTKEEIASKFAKNVFGDNVGSVIINSLNKGFKAEDFEFGATTVSDKLTEQGRKALQDLKKELSEDVEITITGFAGNQQARIQSLLNKILERNTITQEDLDRIEELATEEDFLGESLEGNFRDLGLKIEDLTHSAGQTSVTMRRSIENFAAKMASSDPQILIDGLEAMAGIAKDFIDVTTDYLDGIEVLTGTFFEFNQVGLDTASALSNFKKFLKITQQIDLVDRFITALTPFSKSNEEAFGKFGAAKETFAQQQTEFAQKIFEDFAATGFNAEKFFEVWAKNLDSPKFEQNNNIVVRISGSDSASAAELGDQIVANLRNRRVPV